MTRKESVETGAALAAAGTMTLAATMALAATVALAASCSILYFFYLWSTAWLRIAVFSPLP